MFETFIPHPALQPYVTAIAISETSIPGSYKVLPGTGVVLGFQYSGKLKQLSDGKGLDLAAAGVTGLHDYAKTFAAAGDTGSVLVYFREGKASAFFKPPIHELFSQSLGLENFIPQSELLLLEEQLCGKSSIVRKVSLVEEFLMRNLRNYRDDALVENALALVHQFEGNIRVKELCLRLNTSASPLEKRFRAAVGASPKKFASIVRMKCLLRQIPQVAGYEQLMYRVGFYDQSHFIRHFQRFTGSTPGEWVGN